MLIDFQMFNYCNWFMICIIKMYFLSFPGKFLKKWSNQIQKNELILNWLNLLILFPLPKKCVAYYSKLCILNFPALRHCSAVESADSKQNAISKSLFQDSFRHISWATRKMHHTFWKKATFTKSQKPAICSTMNCKSTKRMLHQKLSPPILKDWQQSHLTSSCIGRCLINLPMYSRA